MSERRQWQGRGYLDGTPSGDDPDDPTRAKQFTAPESYWTIKLQTVPGESDSQRIRFLIDDWIRRRHIERERKSAMEREEAERRRYEDELERRLYGDNPPRPK